MHASLSESSLPKITNENSYFSLNYWFWHSRFENYLEQRRPTVLFRSPLLWRMNVAIRHIPISFD